jgi:ribonuclease Z
VALQFDAGRGTVMRLTAAGVELPRLTALFVTHHHSDHLVGLADLVLTRWVIDRGADAPPLPVVVPEGPCVDFCGRFLDVWEHDIAVRRAHTGRDLGPAVDVIAFERPDGLSMVWQHGDVRVMAGQVRHEPVQPAVGYRVETPDGVVAITGDTLVCDEVVELAAGADVLVYEAMRFEPIERLPERRRFILDYHADSRLIGGQAAALGVSTLVLTHLIPPPDSPGEAAAFADDIRSGGFTGELIVADDLDEVRLDRAHEATST